VHWRLWRGETLEPLAKTVGCFERGARYSNTELELTLSVAVADW